MEEVLCWCCEYFRLTEEDKTEIRVLGICTEKNTAINGYDRVCERFLFNSGLHTERIIPEYCENYKKPLLEKERE